MTYPSFDVLDTPMEYYIPRVFGYKVKGKGRKKDEEEEALSRKVQNISTRERKRKALET